MARLLSLWTNGFVVWVVLFSALAWWRPDDFGELKPGIVPGLGIIMFGMGMSLVPGDFLRVLQQPRAIACGVLGQFVCMPLLAWTITRALGMPPDLQLGFIILGACPGGTASNVIVYLARGNVALSVTMTACSTLLAVVLTPALIWALGGEVIPVSFWGLLWSVTKIVFIPVSAGLLVHLFLGERADRANAIFPAVSVLIIVLIIACIVALSRDTLPEAGLLLLGGVVLHNVLGLMLGYGLARGFRLAEQDCRTVAIEVGMQNSGLGVALATAHAAQVPLAALPSGVFSVVHNLTGALLASVSQRTASTSSVVQRDESTNASKGGA